MRALPTVLYTDQPAHMPFKATMFARVHELQEINQQLDRVAQLPNPKKKAWLEENALVLESFLEIFAANTGLEFDLSHIDPELSELLIEYTKNVQELMRVVQSIFGSQKKLN